MNESYDFNSKKFIWLLIMVCILFFVFVVKAFDYLPKKNVSEEALQSAQTSINTQNNVQNDEEGNSEAEEVQKNSREEKRGSIIVSEEDKPDIIDEIEIPNSKLDELQTEETAEPIVQSKLSPEEEALRAIITAKRNVQQNDYKSAIEEYQKVPGLTDNNELIAMSYEGISEVYAATKRYGTALSFAAKAYNASPSSSREMLIARIYYKAGNTENAINRVNNLLKKGFTN